MRHAGAAFQSPISGISSSGAAESRQVSLGPQPNSCRASGSGLEPDIEKQVVHLFPTSNLLDRINLFPKASASRDLLPSVLLQRPVSPGGPTPLSSMDQPARWEPIPEVGLTVLFEPNRPSLEYASQLCDAADPTGG